MPSITLAFTKAAYIDSRTPNAPGPCSTYDTVTIHRDDENNEYGRLYVGFEAFPSALKRKKLSSIYRIGLGNWMGYFLVYGCQNDFNKNTMTWNTRVAGGSESLLYSGSNDYLSRYGNYGPVPQRTISQVAKDVLKHSALYLINFQTPTEQNIVLRAGQNAPYLEVNYLDENVTSQITPLNNTSGYLNPAAAQTFRWDFLSSDANYVCAGDFAQASAAFYWKEHSAGSYNQVSASGSTKSVTIAANTFPGNATIDWYISGTDEDGTTTTSSVYSITTADATATATALAPINTVEDGSGPITFRWNLSNAYGNQPSKVELWWKLPTEGNNNWHVIVSSSTPITEYTTAGGTFPAGEIQWKVRAYNQDNVQGPDSTGSFICVAAPDAPDGISSDGKPYATITWQCAGQQAYRLTVDGKDYGVTFGTGKSFTLQDPLSDGEHTVTVTAQGVYGLWSQPGTGIIQVTNVPGDDITLIAAGWQDAELIWTTEEETSDFYIYRDDVRIGHTAKNAFTDRLALRRHNYYVVNRLAGGYYSKSNVATALLSTEDTLIAAFPPRNWMNIRLTKIKNGKQSFSYQKTANTRHYYGAEYPIAELSPFSDATGSYLTAIRDPDQCAEFEQLKGKIVCLKSRGGVVFVGLMRSLQKSVGRFYTAYSFTVTRTEWEDYVDDALY